MVCEKVAKMTQMCHEDLVPGISACSYYSAAEPRLLPLGGRERIAEV